MDQRGGVTPDGRHLSTFLVVRPSEKSLKADGIQHCTLSKFPHLYSTSLAESARIPCSRRVTTLPTPSRLKQTGL